MALSRPTDPPQVIVLPVTTRICDAFSAWPTVFMNVSMTHTIVCAFVPTSGAGMSYSGPMFPPNACVNRRVIRRSSSMLTARGFIFTPPFAPPNGICINAHFHVIIAASAFRSSRLTLS